MGGSTVSLAMQAACSSTHISVSYGRYPGYAKRVKAIRDGKLQAFMTAARARKARSFTAVYGYAVASIVAWIIACMYPNS